MQTAVRGTRLLRLINSVPGSIFAMLLSNDVSRKKKFTAVI
jgi:hypothetical protein